MHTGRRYFLNYLWILEKTLMEKYIQCVDYWISKNLVTDIYYLVAFQGFIFGVAIGDYRRSSRWKCDKVRRRLLWWMFWCTFLESSCFVNQIAVFPRAYVWGRLHGNLSVFFKNPSIWQNNAHLLGRNQEMSWFRVFKLIFVKAFHPRRSYLTGDMKNLYSFIQGSLE